ncbi:ribosome maturation factor RimM [Conexibacter sp. DBS9H8]|uniref:ribosome maturation factor RimM n=1 Tax=Conexibacter sp. DBS9H8 TaxID=2937801 RepID=UPI00200F1AA6|nr:ribosome maturation factor RimM [Conexibacter sp. DBS9H8]
MVEDGGQLFAGRVASPHGLDGSFHVAEPAPGLLSEGAIVWIDARAYAIDRRAGHDRNVILRLAGVADRAAALALRGATLTVPQSAAPPLGEDEWWATDLEGCRVVDGAIPVGTVLRLVALPSCEVLEVARAQPGPTLLIPLVGDAVRTVDIEAKLIDVDLDFLGER